MPIKQILNEKVPVKIWTDDVELEAVNQLKNMAALPFVFKHIAVMPDVHFGKGNPESFNSCSHGAGRRMSRKKANATFTEQDLLEQTAGVECRKDKSVLDEIPGAYKPIEDVMANQNDLVEIVAELKQVLCVKG